MTYSSSLRAIGQSLEVIRVEVFTLDLRHGSHILRSDSLTPTCRWILRNRLLERVQDSAANDINIEFPGGDKWLSYNSTVISRLQDQARRKRGKDSSGYGRQTHLSRLLRELGAELDIAGAIAFSIDWSPHCVYVQYQTPDREHYRKFFDSGTLHNLALRAKSQRTIEKTVDSSSE